MGTSESSSVRAYIVIATVLLIGVALTVGAIFVIGRVVSGVSGLH